MIVTRVCPGQRGEIRTVAEEIMMAGNSPGWAVELIGERIDLDDFREALKAPSDPWIEDYPTEEGAIPLLRSATWGNLSESTHVFQDAKRIIERLNGESLFLHSDAQPVKVGQVMRFDLDGNRENIIFPITVSFQLIAGNARGRSRARGIAVTNDPPPPRVSNMQSGSPTRRMMKLLPICFRT